ncbi:50S ribosomal protein L25 [Ectothiorhodospira haloalkaliphila]|uniref:Large ribosomal subunit protein bL25 n=1 Tax=Ectothiorhodospira haloalkaliphila TaxID=421628 RepID=W8KMZ2_9GAMM|nr:MULTISPECIES: 50S ribosomal protein L25/general stress protein Ctc [Ectothiorhodospira]AHK78387.1 50S ribosomal protein L25 [Ectothiorhodospira haloalkaliphila]MCG5495646.1 50S ribosomal protein L25/general stress protein Ctc [Ectothiorhodospira variabilis]MCG5498841.1 50S ribosomal protein L25/general stress protein Ctc [Ectothiorhodospira variabilis]MCG5504707.1 50S ribosomal protein L25/general stress protein Ctc [Ectothiorhodospira variabilis]MCG5507864.1 50S ribosomal protein L25/gener
MSANFELQAESRTERGKGASRRLRRAGRLPAIIYGAGKEPVSITLDHSAVWLSQEYEAFYSHILNVTVDGKLEKAIVRDLQRHPYKPFLVHMDLQRVSDNEPVRVHVPLHFLNEETCVGVKKGGGMLSHQSVEVEVECLPRDLPEYIEVDVGEMSVGDSLHLSQLTLPQGVSLTALAQGPDHDLPVVSVLKTRGASTAEDEESEGGEETPEA